MSSCSFSAAHGHVGNVPHVFQQAVNPDDSPRKTQRGPQPQPNVDRKMWDRKIGSNSPPFVWNVPVSNLPVELFATFLGDRMTTSLDAGVQRCLTEFKSSRVDEKQIVSRTKDAKVKKRGPF